MPAESNIGSSGSPLDVVGGYLARGWSPIPIPPKSKAPRANGWQKMRLAEADLLNHFTSRSNIGVLLGEPSDCLIDIDLDHELAVQWADEFMPPTTSEFGRKGKPRSHRLYRVTAPVETHKRQLPDKTMIVELRSTGCQTVFPGSVHPSGELIEWSSDGEPAEVDPETLMNAVGALADWVVTLVDAATAEPQEGDKRVLALSALDGLNPARADSYHEWVAVGMALHSVGADDEMLAVWDDWSRKSAKYQEGKNECAAKWRGFGRRQGVTLGTLIHFARQDGWQAPYERNGKGKHPVTSATGATKSTKTKRRPAPLDPYKPFPVEALPDPVRTFVHEASRALGCDPALVGLPLLAALASTVGNTRRVKLKRTWCEPSILWCAVVAESGQLKTPAHTLALKPLWSRQKRAKREHDEAMEQYERDLLNYDADLADWKKSGRKNDKPAPSKPDLPTMVRFIVSDPTIEALADRLSENDRGLLSARDELAGWVRGFDQYKAGRGGEVAHWLSFHSAQSTIIDRKTGAKKVTYLERPAVGVCGTIQPGVLKAALGREHFDDGLGARLLLAMPPARIKRWTEATVSESTSERVEMIFERLAALDFAADNEGEPIPFDLPLTADAKAAWIAWFNSHNEEQVELTGDLAAAWSKLEGYAPRLALVIHLVRVAADDPTVESPDRIDRASIRAGCTLSDWFGQEAKRVYGVLGESDEDREARRLVELIERHGGRITANDLRKASSIIATNDEAEGMLNGLVKAGRGQWEHAPGGPTGGRPTREFVLIPAETKTETPSIPEENKGLGSGSAQDEPETEEQVWTF